MPTPLPITDRAVRVAVVGLGQIAKLCLPAYAGRTDVEVVGLCDLDADHVAAWTTTFPGAVGTTDLDELLRIDADVVDVLVPTPLHAEVVCRVLDAGFHVQVQKPLARSLEDADRMLVQAAAQGATLRVLEDYVFFPPIAHLRDVVRGGAIGAPVGLHMKIVGSGLGGWDVDPASYVWQFEQSRDGRGMLTFDHGWHQLAIAYWLFGPIRRIFGWIGETEVFPTINIDAPATFVWEHDNGVRGVLDITVAQEMYFRSDYYTGDERVEVTGTRGYARCNRISAQGIQEPSVVVYADGEVRSFHALADRPPDAFAAQAAHGIGFFRGEHAAPVLDAADARAVLEALLCGLDSAARGVPVDIPSSRSSGGTEDAMDTLT